MRPLSKRERQILFCCLIVLGIYCFFNMIWKPLVRLGEELKQKRGTDETVLEKELKVIAKGKEIVPEYNRYLNSFGQKRSDEEQMSYVISAIESLSNQNNVRVSEMKPRKVRKVDFYNIFSVSLTMEGSLQEIIQFVYVLQNPPHYFQIEAIRIEKKSMQDTMLQSQLLLSRKFIPR